MAHGSSNLIHMFEEQMHKAPKVIPHSTVRVNFLRAWVFFAVKVWLIASIIGGGGFIYSFEKNVSLLDQYVRNDFPIVDADMPLQLPKRHIESGTKVVIVQAIEPRGPNVIIPDLGHVAGAQTNIPD